jgi:hypothetical protein
MSRTDVENRCREQMSRTDVEFGDVERPNHQNLAQSRAHRVLKVPVFASGAGSSSSQSYLGIEFEQ